MAKKTKKSNFTTAEIISISLSALGCFIMAYQLALTQQQLKQQKM